MNTTGLTPLRAGTRGSPLALVQTRTFLRLLAGIPGAPPGVEVIISVTGDAVLDRPLAEVGGKGLFAKEIHEALLDGRVDVAVHSCKDLEAEPFSALPHGALVGTSSVRRQAQLLHARPDLKVASIRGNVQTRLRKLKEGECQASMLAMAGLNRLEMEVPGTVVLDPESMVPSSAQGIVGITARADDTQVLELLARIEDAEARVAAEGERSLLGELDGSCRTPIGGHLRIQADGSVVVTGLVARADGTFLLKRSLSGAPEDAARIGRELGASLRTDSPADLFA
jgi:hydroxymethylbilane synthase